MSKNVASTAFRKVDVDLYDEEKYEEEVNESDVLGINDAEVQAILAKGRLSDALQYVLNNAPVESKNQSVKDKAVQSVLKVVTSFKTADIDAAIKDLDQAKLDVLMKYIYRGFELGSEGNGAQLLVWHDKVFSATGLGCIVRVLTDRKRV